MTEGHKMRILYVTRSESTFLIIALPGIVCQVL